MTDIKPTETQNPVVTTPEAPPNDDAPVAVKFIKPWGLYNPDEVAGFPKEKAAFLIEKKLAVKA